MPNLTDSLISKWIENGDVAQLKRNYDAIVKSGKLQRPGIICMLRMCRPDEDDNDPNGLRDFYGKLLNQE
jgi:hypothetical protein